MWVMHPSGFFSIVRKPGDTRLTVRSRVRADLDTLRSEWLPELGETLCGAGSDYPFRAQVDAEHLGRALARMAAGLDYPNFKSEVARVQGHGRARAYGRVWSALLPLEDGERRV